jgi:hypothetical protein
MTQSTLPKPGRKKLDLYIRAHGEENGVFWSRWDIPNRTKVIFYCPPGGLIHSKAADSIILNRVSINATIIHSYPDSKVQIVCNEGRRRGYPSFSEHTNITPGCFSDCEIFWESSSSMSSLIAKKTAGSRIIFQQAFVHLHTESPILNFVPNTSRYKLPCYLSDFFTYIEKDKLPFVTSDCDEINIHWTLCRGMKKNPPLTHMTLVRGNESERLDCWIKDHLEPKS